MLPTYLILTITAFFIAFLFYSRAKQTRVWSYLKTKFPIAQIATITRQIKTWNEERRKSQWLTALKEVIAPVTPKHGQFIRLGNVCGDGGYIVHDDAHPYSCLLSYGILNDVSFDLDFHERWPEAQIHLFDHTIAESPSANPALKFHRVGLGATNSEQLQTLDFHLSSHTKPTDIVFLKIDIEGAEYDSILATPRKSLSNVKQIAIELHDVFWPNTKPIELIRALSKDFAVVHLHANNTGGFTTIDQSIIPRVIEVTFSRKPIATSEVSATFPKTIDKPCDPNQPELSINDLI